MRFSGCLAQNLDVLHHNKLVEPGAAPAGGAMSVDDNAGRRISRLLWWSGFVLGDAHHET